MGLAALGVCRLLGLEVSNSWDLAFKGSALLETASVVVQYGRILRIAICINLNGPKGGTTATVKNQR